MKKEVNLTESEAQSAFSGFSQSSKEIFTYVIFTRATIESVLNKNGITSLRYYPAMKDNHKTVIIVGVKEDGSEDKSSYFATSNIASNELNTMHIQPNEANNLLKFEKSQLPMVKYRTIPKKFFIDAFTNDKYLSGIKIFPAVKETDKSFVSDYFGGLNQRDPCPPSHDCPPDSGK